MEPCGRRSPPTPPPGASGATSSSGAKVNLKIVAAKFITPGHNSEEADVIRIRWDGSHGGLLCLLPVYSQSDSILHQPKVRSSYSQFLLSACHWAVFKLFSAVRCLCSTDIICCFTPGGINDTVLFVKWKESKWVTTPGLEVKNKQKRDEKKGKKRL